MRPARLLSLCLALGCATSLGAAAAAAAPALAQARGAYGELNYEACRKQARAALGEPGAGDERVEAYRLLGLCEAALGETEAAKEAFVTMLGIDPGAALPAGLSPRFTSSYLEAKDHWLGKEPLGFTLESDDTEGRTRTVRFSLSDPLDLVTQVSWDDEEGERAPPVAAAERMELELPAERARRLVALDAAGGAVAVLALPPRAPPPGQATEVSPPTAEAEAEGGVPWLWVGAAAGGGALLFGAVAAVTTVLLLPPRAVPLRSEIVFGNQ
jgi:hypothetical protein